MDQCWKAFSKWWKSCHCKRVFSVGVTKPPEKKTIQTGISISGSCQILKGQTQRQKFHLFCSSPHELLLFGGRRSRVEATQKQDFCWAGVNLTHLTLCRGRGRALQCAERQGTSWGHAGVSEHGALGQPGGQQGGPEGTEGQRGAGEHPRAPGTPCPSLPGSHWGPCDLTC